MVTRIGIFGHVGNENLGDEAAFAAVVQNIQCRDPNATIYGFSINPEDTAKRHKITAFPIRRIHKPPPDERCRGREAVHTPGSRSNLTERIKIKLKTVPLLFVCLRAVQKSWHIALDSVAELRFLIECYRTLKGVELIIIAGSQQLIDYVGGSWAFPYTLFKWVLLAKFVKAKVAFVSVGAGPIRSRLGKFFIRRSLVLARYCSYRDDSSRKCIEALGVAGQNTVLPDLVYSLRLDGPSDVDFRYQSLPIVGINAVPIYDSHYWLGANGCLYEAYIGKLARFALWIIQRGYGVLFFPTQLRLDPMVITDIQNRMRNEGKVDLKRKVIDKPISSFDDLVSAIKMTDIVVASRFHGIVIPYVLNKPVLGIAYHEKTTDLMVQMGQSAYVVDINSFDVESLKTRFRSLESSSKLIEKHLRQKNLVLRHALQKQYDRVLNLA